MLGSILWSRKYKRILLIEFIYFINFNLEFGGIDKFLDIYDELPTVK
jgi:hypothetical protein